MYTSPLCRRSVLPSVRFVPIVAVRPGDVQVIEPIQSRCAILRFTRLSDAEVLSRLLYVCDQEKVPAPIRLVNHKFIDRCTI